MVPSETTTETQNSNEQRQKFEPQPDHDQISTPVGEIMTKKSSLMPEVLSGREKLKRHRMEVAGHVWIPDLWGQEELLKEWIDCSAFDSTLFPNGLSCARAALVEEGRRVLLLNNKSGTGGGLIRNNIGGGSSNSFDSSSSSLFRINNNGIKSGGGGGLRTDCSSFDSSLYPSGVLKSARAALIEEGRRANSSGGLRI